MAESKKLYKTKEGATFSGVCKGMSEVYGWDVSILRIILVISTLFMIGIPLLIVYLIMAMVLPNKEDVVIDKKADYTIDDDDYIY